jgi:hypothetical protein
VPLPSDPGPAAPEPGSDTDKTIVPAIVPAALPGPADAPPGPDAVLLDGELVRRLAEVAQASVRKAVADAVATLNTAQPEQPQAPKMDAIGFGAYLVESGDRTKHFIMILLASAVAVAIVMAAIWIAGIHAQPVITVGLTSAGGVVVTAATRARAARKKRAAEHESQRDSGGR